MTGLAGRSALVLILLSPTVALAQHVHPEPSPAQSEAPAPAPLPPFIPALTDADRAVAYPDVGDHEVHGASTHSLVMFDQIEWRSGPDRGALGLHATGWVGGDLDRLWFRADADVFGGRVDSSTAQVFYGRAVARWWDVVAGVRQDVDSRRSRTWAAIGIQGLAPYWFELEATAYIGESGRTQVHVATEYELLLTNRLVLQSAGAVDLNGKADPDRQIGAGLSSVEAALRLRYEIRRQFAPYAGIVWHRRTFGTADLARVAGDQVGDVRIVLGVRAWF